MKQEILNQIKTETRERQYEEQMLRDAEYFKALAQNKKLPSMTRGVARSDGVSEKKELTRRLRALSGLPAKLPKENKLPDFKKIYDTLDKYISSFPTHKNIVFIGAAGTGKTYAAQYVGAKLLDRGFSVLYITAFSLVQKFKEFIFEGSSIDWFLSCDLLIIDDLGTEPKIKNISDEYLLNVINERMAHERPFIITTNLAPDDILARYDERLTSRILSKQTSVVIEMKGKDLRLN